MPGICARCRCPVYCAEERVAIGKVWHNFCFSCCECKKLLDSSTYESDGNELYCKNCLRWRSNAPDCHCDDQCGDQIPSCRSCPPPPCSVADWCRQSSPPCSPGYPQIRVSCSPTNSIYTQSNGACTNTVYSQQYMKGNCCRPPRSCSPCPPRSCSPCCPPNPCSPCPPCPSRKPSRCKCCTKKNRNRLYSLNDNLCQKCNAGQKIQVFLNASCDPCEPKPSCRCCKPRCGSPPCSKPRCDSPPCCKPRCNSPPCCKPRCNSPPCCKPRCDSPPCCKPRCDSPPCCKPRCDSPPCCKPRCDSPPCCKPRCGSPPRCQVRCGSPKPRRQCNTPRRCPSPGVSCTMEPASCLLNASTNREARCCHNKCFSRCCDDRPRCREDPCCPARNPGGCPPRGRRCPDYPPTCPATRCEPVVVCSDPCPPVCVVPACEPCNTCCECSEPRNNCCECSEPRNNCCECSEPRCCNCQMF